MHLFLYDFMCSNPDSRQCQTLLSQRISFYIQMFFILINPFFLFVKFLLCAITFHQWQPLASFPYILRGAFGHIGKFQALAYVGVMSVILPLCYYSILKWYTTWNKMGSFISRAFNRSYKTIFLSPVTSCKTMSILLHSLYLPYNDEICQQIPAENHT